MSGEDRFAEWMRREAAEYQRLPEPAPEAKSAMWARIEGSVSETVTSYGTAALGPRPTAVQPRRTRTWLWSAGIAAALVMGVAIGRVTAPSGGTLAETDPAERTIIVETRPASSDVPPAVVDHLARSVVFLASFREDARSGAVDGAARDRGRDLLTATQIMMDSPASQDPRMRAVLEDLELVLAQIAHLNARRPQEEARIATDAMRQRDILPRLRTLVPQEAIDESVATGSGADD